MWLNLSIMHTIITLITLLTYLPIHALLRDQASVLGRTRHMPNTKSHKKNRTNVASGETPHPFPHTDSKPTAFSVHPLFPQRSRDLPARQPLLGRYHRSGSDDPTLPDPWRSFKHARYLLHPDGPGGSRGRWLRIRGSPLLGNQLEQWLEFLHLWGV